MDGSLQKKMEKNNKSTRTHPACISAKLNKYVVAPLEVGLVEYVENKNTRCAWAGGTCANNPDFFENHQFHVIYCVTLGACLNSIFHYFTPFLAKSWPFN